MAKNILDEVMRYSIIINGDQAQKELTELEDATRKLTATNKELKAEQARLVGQGKKNSEEYKRLSAEITQNNKVIGVNKDKMKVLQSQIGVTSLTLAQLSSKANQLRLQLRNMVPGSAQYKKLELELKEVSARMTELRTNAKATKLSIGSIADGFSKYAALGASVIATATGVVLSLQKMIDYNGKLADAQSNVQKTTGLTTDEVNELSKSFGLMKTRTARIELLELAEEAGRLGITGTKNIKDFVEVANQMKVALGDDLSTEAIREVGKMVNIYKVGEKTGRDFKNSLLSLGSAINEVAASGANQADYLVDYMKRQAGVAAQTRLSAQDNIGYAATFDELGQSVEVSATAMNKVWVDMFADAATYAKIAGVSVEEFTTLLNTDANKAMILFLKGLNGNNEGLTVMVDKLKDLDVGGARGTQTLAALAANTDLLEKRQTTANKALVEATSLTNEYGLKNNNLAATIDKVKKALIGAFSSEFWINGLSNLIGGFAKLIGAVENAEEAFNRQIEAVSKSAKANRKAADESAVLLKEYQDLTKEGIIPTTESKKRLEEITLLLRDRLGESVVSIDKETNSLRLNTEAVKEQIKQKSLAADAEALQLASRLSRARANEKEIYDELVRADNELNNRKNMAIEENGGIYASTVGLKGRAVSKRAEDYKANRMSEAEKREYEAAQEFLKIQQKITANRNQQLKLVQELAGMNVTEADAIALFEKAEIPTPTTETTTPTFTPTTTPLSDKEKNDAKKRAEDLLKLQREAEDDRLKAMQEGFDKEMLLEDFNHYRKIEDLQAKLVSQKLIQKTSDENLKASYIAHNKAINSQIESELELHEIRKATILEKGFQNDIELKQAQYEREKIARETAFNNELAALGTNEAARKKLQKEYDKESLEAEKAHLEDLVSEINKALTSGDFKGFDFELLSDQQIEAIKSKLADLGLSISEINALLAVMRGKSVDNESIFSGDSGKTDVLGFSADDWVNTFTNIEGLTGGIAAAAMAVQGLLNAWSMYNSFVSKNQQQELENFEKATDKKKAKQKQLLDSGYINERQYDDAIAALEAEAEKRREELAYKQAKRDKEMSLIGAVTGTASAVVGALGNKPWTPANFILAGIVGALGLAQVGLIAGTKLPAKGYESGYYQVQREQDGKLFNAAYGGESRTGLVDKPTVFLAGEGGKNFPEMIIDGRSMRQMNPDVKQALYGELARVKGYERGYNQTQTTQPQFNTETSTVSTDPLLVATLTRTNQLLEIIEKDGIVAVIDKNFRNIKKLQEELDNYNKLKLKNKR